MLVGQGVSTRQPTGVLTAEGAEIAEEGREKSNSSLSNSLRPPRSFEKPRVEDQNEKQSEKTPENPPENQTPIFAIEKNQGCLVSGNGAHTSDILATSQSRNFNGIDLIGRPQARATFSLEQLMNSRCVFVRHSLLAGMYTILIGCGEPSMPTPPVTTKTSETKRNEITKGDKTTRKATAMYMIQYVHVFDGNFYHGTISDLDGRPRSTWSFEELGTKVTREYSIDDERFNELWNQISESPVFRRCLISGRDLDKQMDWGNFHCITATFSENEQEGTMIFAVPAGETDPSFVRWLDLVNIPNQSKP